jgi:hypothetical protein
MQIRAREPVEQYVGGWEIRDITGEEEVAFLTQSPACGSYGNCVIRLHGSHSKDRVCSFVKSVSKEKLSFPGFVAAHHETSKIVTLDPNLCAKLL